MGRRRWVAGVVGVALALTGCTGTTADDPSPTPPPPPSGPTGAAQPSDDELADVDWSQLSWAQVQSLVDEDGSSTVEQAVAAFQVAFEPLPDAPAPLPVDLSAPLSGTHALELMARHVDELTPAQVEFLQSRPGLDVTGSRERVDPEARGESATTTVVPVAQPLAAVADDKTPSVEPTDVPTVEDPSATAQERARWNRLAREAWDDLGRRTGETETLNDEGLPWTISLATPDPTRSSGAWTRGTASDDGRPTCDIWIWNLRAPENRDSRSMGLYHELVHCAMWVLARSTAQYDSLPQWMIEGLTSWAGEVGGGPSSWSRRWWSQYRCTACRHGTWSMVRADYDAIGFWSFLDDRGANLWAAFADLSRVRGGRPLWELAVGLLPDQDDMAELASAATQGPFGPAWEMDGPTIVPTGRPIRDAGRLRLGGTAQIRVSSLKQGSISLQRPAETGPLLVEAHIVGLATASWDTGSQVQVVDTVQDVAWCLGCTCPDGTVVAPDVPPVDDAATTLAVAVTPALGNSAWAEVTVRRPDDACDEPEPDTPPPGPPPPPTGRSNGDPHLVTFDGRGYDFHAVGEFVLARDDDVEIQVRQAPLVPALGVSGNEAVVVATDDAVVQVEADRVLVDGQPRDVVEMDLPGGGRVEASPGELSWELADGSRIEVSGRQAVVMALADGRRMTGLLGDGNGVRDDDFRLASGEVLDVATTAVPPRDVLYGEFADAWRVDAGTSRFTYGPGESTEGFTDRTFPGRTSWLDDLSARALAGAEATCDQAGVDDPLVRDGCLLDVGATDDGDWAIDAAILEGLLAELAAAFGSLPTTAPTEASSSPVDEDLLAGARACDVGSVERALAAGASPNASDGRDTALHLAVQVPDVDCTATVQALVDAGADVARFQTSPDKEFPPIHLVRDPAVAVILLDAGADPNLELPTGEVPLDTILLHQGESLAGTTAAPLVSTLLEAGANPDGGSNRSLLVAAVSGRDAQVVRVLLAAGADPDPRLGDESTPLHEAGFVDRDGAMVEALLEGGADPDARDVRGNTPLHNGVLTANNAGIGALLERGADPCLRNEAGQTPAGIAMAFGRDDIADLFPSCPG